MEGVGKEEEEEEACKRACRRNTLKSTGRMVECREGRRLMEEKAKGE